MLRDLASIAAYPSAAEFRTIEIVAIDGASPVKVRLRLLSISPEAVAAFQAICRDLNRVRGERPSLPAFKGMTDQEAERLHRHVAALQDAPIPLKRVRVSEA